VTTLRGLLAVGLLAGFYVLAFVLVAADAVLVTGAVWAMFTAPSSAGSWGLVVASSVPAVAALLYGVATASRSEDQPPGSVLLRKRDAPGLWQLVADLAEQLHTRPPTRIFLTPEANAAVSEEPRMLGFAVGERTLYLGAPLLTSLTTAELRAVLCHEFGHYAGGHTRFGAITYRGAASLSSTLFRLRMTAQSNRGIPGYAGLFHAAIGLYAKVYLRLSLAVRRRQELEADARAAALAGPAVAASALRSMHALGHAWDGFLDRFVRPVRQLGYVPADLFGAFATMMDDPLVQERLAELRERPVEANRSRLDSHPPLARRLTLIEAEPARGHRVLHSGPLWAGRDPLKRVATKLLTSRTRATALPWDRWADLAAEAFAVELASLLLDAVRGTGVTVRPTLGTVLDLLERGNQMDIAGRLTEAPEPEQQLAEALYALVGQVLVGAGRARWVLSWTKGYLLACDQDHGWELEDLVTAAARDGAAVGTLRDKLAALGIPVEAPVPLVLRTVSAPAGRTTGAPIAAQVPGFVTEEAERQRGVRRFTVAALLVLGVLWGVAMIRSDGSDHYSPVGTNLRTDWAARPPTYAPVVEPPPAWLRPDDPLPSEGPQLPLYPTWNLWPSLPRVEYVDVPIIVKRGDTLTKIACRYHTTVRTLQKLNDMGSRTSLSAGQTLLVPGRPTGIVDAGCR
jgi:Zn-dependent protease with chaperone function